MRLFISLLCVISIFPISVASPDNIAKIRILVVDGKTNEPIGQANICILECERYYKTDSLGYSPEMFIETKKHSDEPPFSRPKISILVYKDGYLDTIVLGVELFDGICRLGPTVKLYQKNDLDNEIKKQYDFPDEKFLQSVIEKYRK